MKEVLTTLTSKLGNKYTFYVDGTYDNPDKDMTRYYCINHEGYLLFREEGETRWSYWSHEKDAISKEAGDKVAVAIMERDLLL